MSNSTRPGGYDERLVVPLEASRRGAHRARVNPLMGVLPVLAVVVVVAAVIGVAYTLFLRGSNGTDDTATGTGPTATAPANTKPAATTSPGGASNSTPATSPSASQSTPAATVNKATAFSVYNGSTPPVNGLGAKAQTALLGAGWTKANLVKGGAPAQSTTTHAYYAKDSQRATAEAIVKSLGVGSAKLSTSIAGSGIVVVVGNDYNG